MHFNRSLAFAVLVFVLAAPWASSQMTIATEVAIKVSQPWTDTEIDVVSRDVPIRITATGWADFGLVSRVLLRPVGDSRCRGSLGTPFLAPDLTCWALIGRIGGGAPFLVGNGATIEPKDLGRLFLGVNDELFYFADNGGEWTATISVERQGGAPTPTDIVKNANVIASLTKALEGASRSTMLSRLASREEWTIRAPERRRQLPPLVLEIAGKLPGPDERSWDDTEAAVRQGLDAIETLVDPDLGPHAKALLIRIMTESLVEATPAIAAEEVDDLARALARAAREGLTPAVQELLASESRPRYVVAACAKAAVTIKLRGNDDVVVIRHRSSEGTHHRYDVFATWTEQCSPGRKETLYGDVRIGDGRQGYARHQLTVTTDGNGGFVVTPGVEKAHFSLDDDGLWPRGEIAALLK